jgi:hypothetical protein
LPDFEGSKPIFLQPSDAKVPYAFEYTVCSATTANDGSLPFGHTLSSVVTAIHREDATVLTTAILSTSSATGQVHTVFLSYPTSVGVVTGKHHLTFTATISDGTTTYVREFDFNRLIVRNL